MYIPVAQRTNKETSFVGGYIPVDQRKPVTQEEIKLTPNFLDDILSTRTSTPAVLPEGFVGIGEVAGRIAKDVGQSIARNIASAALSLATISPKKVVAGVKGFLKREVPDIIVPTAESLKAEDFQSFIAQGFFETIFGQGVELKSIEQRIVEAEPKVEQWKKEIEEVSHLPDLNARERFVTKVLGNLDTPSITFLGIMGSVGLDLTPFGGLEKNVYRAFVKETTEEGAELLLKKMGVADDLARNFAPNVVKVTTEKEAKALFSNIVKLQETTKVTPRAYMPVAERAIPMKKLEEFESLAQEARKFKSAEEFVKAQGTPLYHGTPNQFDRFEMSRVGERGRTEGRGFYFTDKKDIAEQAYTSIPGGGGVSPNGRVIEAYLDLKKPMTTTQRNVSDVEWRKLLIEIDKKNNSITDNYGSIDEAIKLHKETGGTDIDFLSELGNVNVLNHQELNNLFTKITGYDGVIRKEADGTIFVAFNPDQIKTKSQLTDIWERANKVKGEDVLRAEAKAKGLPELPRISKASGQIVDETGDIASKAPQKSQLPPRTAELPSRPVSKATETPPKSISEATYDSKIAEKSKIVNSDTSKKPLSESIYEANRTNLTKKKGLITKTAESLSDIRRSIGEGTDKLLGTISTRLKNIDPSLKTSIRTFEYKLAQSTQKDRRASESFLKGAKDISIKDYADLDLALKNGDATKTSEIIRKYGLEEDFAKVRATLDDLYKRAEDVGYDIGYEKNYFPRTIKDSGGMLEYFQKGDDWSIIDEAIKTKELDLGRYLTIDEKANVINTLVRGYPTGKITLSETGAMKARRIDIVDAELNQFYNDSVESLIRYIDTTNDAIEARRFFGKGNKTDAFANIDDSIGSYILDLIAKGKIKPSQEKELRDVLQARFAQVGTSGVVRVYKNLSYIDTMGSPISAITQLGDLAFAIYKGGPVQAAKAFGRALVGKSKITRADIGIEKIAQEFEGASSSARAVDKVFRAIGLHKLDALGKETVINASVGRLRKVAEEPSADFIRRMELVFGDDPNVIARVTDDLKAGKITEDTKLLAFNELLDVQPVALSEMPEQYLKGGNGRIFYMLKTYTIKLFDVYRNEVFQTMKTDKVQGMKNLLYLTGALVTMNATADEIKDLILNRETSLKDRTVDNILKLAGFSKFTIYKARQEGIGSAVAKTILPPFKFIDSAYKDIVQANEVAQLETIQSIPVAGKLYYWWFGKGATKTEQKRQKGGDSTGAGLLSLPKLPQLPQLPKLPKLPKL